MQQVRLIVKSSFLCLLIILASCREPQRDSNLHEAWNPQNDPVAFGSFANTAFREIPKNGRLPQMPWSDYYWATFRGGISFRWQYSHPNTNDYRHFLYEIMQPDQVKNLSNPVIAGLSPSEKYDIAMGRYDLPLTQRARQQMLNSVQNGGIPTWYGICHGWASASVAEPEPQQPILVRNQDGQEVVFFPSDLKALISKVYADAQLNTRNLGQRCNENTPTSMPNGRPAESRCRDVNPGSFHLALTDYVSVQKKPFIADISPAHEVWNQPVTAYSFRYRNLRAFNANDPLAEYRAPGTTQLVDVVMTMEYAKEALPSTRPHGTRVDAHLYQYTLELNSQDNIIGGEWQSKTRPDFLWAFSQTPSGEVAGIDVAWVKDLILKSRGGSPEPLPPVPEPGNPPPEVPPGPNPPPTPPPAPEGTLLIDFVSVAYRGTTSATATVWANALAPQGSYIHSYVVFGNQRQRMHQLRVMNGERFQYSFSYTPSGSTGYYFELLSPDGRVLAAIERGLP